MCECPRDCICNSSGNCSRCVNDNFYGPLCDQVCSYLCLNRTCDFFTGNCNKGCKLGYFGNKCNRTGRSNCHYLILICGRKKNVYTVRKFMKQILNIRVVHVKNINII
jgi:hypothetical protein